MATAHKRASAKRDLVEHYVYLAENADVTSPSGFCDLPKLRSANWLANLDWGLRYRSAHRN